MNLNNKMLIEALIRARLDTMIGTKSYLTHQLSTKQTQRICEYSEEEMEESICELSRDIQATQEALSEFIKLYHTT